MTTEEKHGNKQALSNLRPTWRLTRILNPKRFSYLLLLDGSTRKLIIFDVYPAATEQNSWKILLTQAVKICKSNIEVLGFIRSGKPVVSFNY